MPETNDGKSLIPATNIESTRYPELTDQQAMKILEKYLFLLQRTQMLDTDVIRANEVISADLREIPQAGNVSFSEVGDVSDQTLAVFEFSGFLTELKDLAKDIRVVVAAHKDYLISQLRPQIIQQARRYKDDLAAAREYIQGISTSTDRRSKATDIQFLRAYLNLEDLSVTNPLLEIGLDLLNEEEEKVGSSEPSSIDAPLLWGDSRPDLVLPPITDVTVPEIKAPHVPLPEELKPSYLQNQAPRYEAMINLVHALDARSTDPKKQEDVDKALKRLARIFVQTTIQISLPMKPEAMAKFDWENCFKVFFNQYGTFEVVRAKLAKNNPLTALQKELLEALDFLKRGQRMTDLELFLLFKEQLKNLFNNLPTMDVREEGDLDASTPAGKLTKAKRVAKKLKDEIKGDSGSNEELHSEEEMKKEVTEMFQGYKRLFPTERRLMPGSEFIKTLQQLGFTDISENDLINAFREGKMTGQPIEVDSNTVKSKLCSQQQLISFMYDYNHGKNTSLEELKNIRIIVFETINEATK